VLIAERGLSELRVGDVAEHADIALGTFYSYFTSKDELVAAIVSEALTALTDALSDLGEQMEPAEAFSIGVRRFIRLAVTDPDLARLLVGLQGAESLLETVVWERSERIMVRGVEAGDFHVENLQMSLSVAVAGVFVTLQRVVNSAEQPSSAEQCAVALLQLVGFDPARAPAVARRPLPDVHPSVGRDDESHD
jgi:AcrR family transcriptional regulator